MFFGKLRFLNFLRGLHLEAFLKGKASVVGFINSFIHHQSLLCPAQCLSESGTYVQTLGMRQEEWKHILGFYS